MLLARLVLMVAKGSPDQPDKQVRLARMELQDSQGLLAQLARSVPRVRLDKSVPRALVSLVRQEPRGRPARLGM